jgi:hypothetical protein
MRGSEEAASRLRSVSSLAVLAAIIFTLIKTLPAYVNNYQLQDHIRQLAIQLSVRTTPATPDEIRDEVIAFAQDHGIQLTADNIKVGISRRVTIKLDYIVPVDLILFTLKLHFTPSAENESL